MRAGRLRHRATVYSKSADVLGGAWLSIIAKDAGDVSMPAGIRASAMVTIRARYNGDLKAGVYLRSDDRLFQVTSARDVMGTRHELILSADEFIGDTATYNGKQIRIHLTHSAPYYDDFGKVTDYRLKAEVLLFETGRVQAGDTITVDGKSYIVTQYADGTDDGVVRSLWLDEA